MEFRTEKLDLMRLEAAERAQQEEIEEQKKHDKEMKELKRRKTDRKRVFSWFLFEFFVWFFVQLPGIEWVKLLSLYR